MPNDLPHRTTLSGSTLEHRRPLELGDRLTLIVEAQVTAIGTKRVSDGDIEVRTLRASDILELPGNDGNLGIDDAIAEARRIRRAEADERNGALTLDFEAAELWLISFADCGHDANYPEDWLRVEESALTDPVVYYFRNQERPDAGDLAPCPLCYLDNPDLEPGAVGPVAAVGHSPAAPKADTMPLIAEIGDIDAFVAEHIPDYVDLDPADLLVAFDELPGLGLGAWQSIAAFESDTFPEDDIPDRDEVVADLAARIAHFAETAPWDGYDDQAAAVIRDHLKTRAHLAREVYAYEAAHKARKAILGAAEGIYAVPDAGDSDTVEETF